MSKKQIFKAVLLVLSVILAVAKSVYDPDGPLKDHEAEQAG